MKNYILPLLLGGVLGASIIYFVGQSDAPPEADTLKTMNTKIPQDIIECLSEEFNEEELKDLGMLNWLNLLAASKDSLLDVKGKYPEISAMMPVQWTKCQEWIANYKSDGPRLRSQFNPNSPVDEKDMIHSWFVDRDDILKCLQQQDSVRQQQDSVICSGMRIHLALQIDTLQDRSIKHNHTLVLCGTKEVKDSRGVTSHENVLYKGGYAMEYLKPCPRDPKYCD